MSTVTSVAKNVEWEIRKGRVLYIAKVQLLSA